MSNLFGFRTKSKSEAKRQDNYDAGVIEKIRSRTWPNIERNGSSRYDNVIQQPEAARLDVALNLFASGTCCAPGERQRRIGHATALIWLNGGADIAYAAERKLFDRGYLTHVSHGHTDGTLLLRLAQTAIAAGLITICPANFAYERERTQAQALVDPDSFLDLDLSQSDSAQDAADQLCEMLAARGILPL
jgi:hypothetical protein